jgi:hypothetical protein
LKHIELKLAVMSVALIAIGFFLFPITATLFPTSDHDVAEILGFLLMIVVGGFGVALGIASIGVLLFRLRNR